MVKFFSSLIKTFFIPIAVVMIIGFLAYTGMMIYGNMTHFGDIIPADPPSIEKAPYQVFIDANNNVLYTSDYFQDGTVYVIRGYYEEIKGKYRYRDIVLSLDEVNFGRIIITRR